MSEQDLAILLRTMEPVLHPEPYGYGVWAGGVLLIEPAAGMRSDPWARISLTEHSDVAAVGLTAAFAKALGGEAISCNVITGNHHDHPFVQWDRRGQALAALRRLAIA
jgi:hypothetical protein